MTFQNELSQLLFCGGFLFVWRKTLLFSKISMSQNHIGNIYANLLFGLKHVTDCRFSAFIKWKLKLCIIKSARRIKKKPNHQSSSPTNQGGVLFKASELKYLTACRLLSLTVFFWILYVLTLWTWKLSWLTETQNVHSKGIA